MSQKNLDYEQIVSLLDNLKLRHGKRLEKGSWNCAHGTKKAEESCIPLNSRLIFIINLSGYIHLKMETAAQAGL